MKFNWILSKEVDQNQKKRCIDLEYKLRPKIIKFLLERFDTEDFSSLHFDVFVATEKVVMGRNTPLEYVRLFGLEFEKHFNTREKITTA